MTWTWVVVAMWGCNVVVVSRRAAPVWPNHGQSPGRSTAAVVVVVVVVVDVVELERKIM